LQTRGLTAIFLFVVALGIFSEPTPGYFAVGVSMFVLVSWVSVLISLEIVLRASPNGTRQM